MFIYMNKSNIELLYNSLYHQYCCESVDSSNERLECKNAHNIFRLYVISMRTFTYDCHE